MRSVSEQPVLLQQQQPLFSEMTSSLFNYLSLLFIVSWDSQNCFCSTTKRLTQTALCAVPFVICGFQLQRRRTIGWYLPFYIHILAYYFALVNTRFPFSLKRLPEHSTKICIPCTTFQEFISIFAKFTAIIITFPLQR